jgi:hypothetical protein
MARAAGHGTQQTVHALWHQDAIRELQWLVLDKDVALTHPGMRGVVFVDTMGVESKFGDSDAIGFASGQAGCIVGSRVSLGEVILTPDAPSLPNIDVMGAVAVVGKLVLRETELPRFITDGLGHFCIILKKPQVAFAVRPVALEDALALGGIGLRPSPVFLGEIEGFAGYAGVSRRMRVV